MVYIYIYLYVFPQDYVEKLEFRLLLQYTREYFELYQLFSGMSEKVGAEHIVVCTWLRIIMVPSVIIAPYLSWVSIHACFIHDNLTSDDPSRLMRQLCWGQAGNKYVGLEEFKKAVPLLKAWDWHFRIDCLLRARWYLNG
jgi:hypothetical protein